MATYKAEFLAHYYARQSHPLRELLFGHIDWWALAAARMPRLVNTLAAIRPVARPLQAALGISPERRLPRLASRTFQHWMARHAPRSEGTPVILWSDTFTNYFYPHVGRAAVHVLEHLGYHVIVPPQTCCGRPLYDFGLLESAREHLRAVFEVLTDERHRHAPIVVLEPSCFAVFQDEARNLSADTPIAQALAGRTVLFDTFVRAHFERGDLPPLSISALVHVHCHQQAIIGRESVVSTLAAAGVDAQVPDAGCCGMAGSFGFDRQHYQVSMAIGERVLMPAVRQAPQAVAIIADGFSCREQIRHATSRQASHFAELVSRTIEGPP
jgi:Fe-S oxidoreductase